MTYLYLLLRPSFSGPKDEYACKIRRASREELFKQTEKLKNKCEKLLTKRIAFANVSLDQETNQTTENLTEDLAAAYVSLAEDAFTIIQTYLEEAQNHIKLREKAHAELLELKPENIN
jgi:hypothetical protein